MSSPIVVDSDGNALPAPVDQPAAARPREAEGAPARLRHRVLAATAEPVVPPWARDRSELGQAARWVARYTSHTAAFHTVRTPLYAARLAARSPRGLARAVRTACVWAADREGRAARDQVVEAREPERYAKLAELHTDTVRRRTALVTLTGMVAVLAAVVAWLSGHPGIQAVALVAAVGILGRIGVERDRPIVSRAVTATKAERLTAEVVERALVAAVPQVKDGDVAFPSPITRDGPGWRADVDLPHGVTATHVMGRREELASGLRRPEGAVWPEKPHGQHAGRLVLWVGDEAFADARQPVWPLARSGQVDLFRPIPFGSDQRHRPVTVPLMYSNVLIGALPGAGKTVALRVLGLGCALDPRAELHVAELKGTGDLEALEQVAHRYGSGPDEATVEAAMHSLRYARGECERRARQINGLPREHAPDNKVTTALASRRHLGLHPLVVIVDECHELFEHPTYGKEAGDLATRVIKQGRAVGVILLLATQRPDASSLPTGVSANAGIRFCLRVMSHTENDMILGTSAHRNGIRATMFTVDDLGIGWLVGAARTSQIARSAYVDRRAAMRIGERARALRVQAGTLGGHAAGDQPDSPDDALQLLTDVLAVIGDGEPRVWSSDVVERLQQLRPDRYDGWDQSQLAFALKPYGVDTRAISRRAGATVTSRRGVLRADVIAALDRRRAAARA